MNAIKYFYENWEAATGFERFGFIVLILFISLYVVVYTFAMRCPDDVLHWIHNNVKYVSDEKAYGKDYWQTPHETLTIKKGDCEDQALLMLDMCRQYWVFEGNMISVKIEGGGYHAIAYIEGVYYDTTANLSWDKCPYDIVSCTKYTDDIRFGYH